MAARISHFLIAQRVPDNCRAKPNREECDSMLDSPLNRDLEIDPDKQDARAALLDVPSGVERRPFGSNMSRPKRELNNGVVSSVRFSQAIAFLSEAMRKRKPNSPLAG